MSSMDEDDMDVVCICVICKKLFTDKEALLKHRINQHYTQEQLAQIQFRNLEQELEQEQEELYLEEENLDIYSTEADSTCESEEEEEVVVVEERMSSAPFRNNKSLTITRVPNVKKTAAMNQNQKPLRKVPPGSGSGAASQSINVRRAEMKLKLAEGRAKAASGGPAGGPVSGTNAKWQKWVHRNASGDPQQAPAQAHPPPSQYQNPNSQAQSSDGMIITPSAAERATSAFCSSAAELTPSPRGKVIVRGQAGQGNSLARKTVPHLIPMATNQNGNSNNSNSQKRPAPGTVTTRPAPGSGRSSTTSPVVPDIMSTLGKIKSLNQQARTSAKVLPAAAAATAAAASVTPPPFRMAKPPQVPKGAKGKIIPRNAYNNALPKPGSGSGGGGGVGTMVLPPRLHVEQDMDLDDDDPDEDYFNPPHLSLQQEQSFGRKSIPAPKQIPKNQPAPPSSKNSNGKAPPQKSLSSNRHNPIASTSSKQKGQGRQAPAAASSSSSGPSASSTNSRGSSSSEPKRGNASSSSSKSNGNASSQSQSQVVAKKSAPKSSSHEDRMRKMKQYVPTMPGTNYEMPSLSAVGSYTNRDGQQVWVCLVCKAKEQEESSQDMICCDTCEDWYHWGCVGISSVNEDDPWYCKRCIFQASRNPTKDFPTLFKSNVPP